MPRVLLVDDRPENRQALGALLTAEGYQVQEAAGVSDAVARIRALPIELVISDVRMQAEDDGLTLLRTIKSESPQLPVILYSGYARVSDAILAGKLGASDYLEFPVDPDRILHSVSSALESGRTPLSNDTLSDDQRAERFHDIIAASPAMRSVLGWVACIGPTELPALVTGETGTGKELVAHALHALSRRCARAFIPVNCSAIPEGLFEAELFGSRKGAFTGAVGDRRGLFEEADRGTIFLDEIGELPLAMQARLLRFLEAGEVRRLGENKTRLVDVRVIAATNRRLDDESAHGDFRADLYHRLKVAKYHLPPLRDRPEDLEPLIGFWLPRLAEKLASEVRGLSPGSLLLLRRHSWPGNVRELRNVLEHALCLAAGDLITEREIAVALDSPSSIEEAGSRDGNSPAERDRLLAALEQHHWHVERTAQSLGINRSTLWRRLRKFGIRRAHEPV